MKTNPYKILAEKYQGLSENEHDDLEIGLQGFVNKHAEDERVIKEYYDNIQTFWKSWHAVRELSKNEAVVKHYKELLEKENNDEESLTEEEHKWLYACFDVSSDNIREISKQSDLMPG
jgi:hypothetical protein